MKRILALMSIFLMISSGYAVTLSVADPSPYPLESNQAFSVTVQLYNNGLSRIDDYSIGIIPEYPFKTVSGETYEYKLGDIEPKTTVYKTFRLLTYDNVPEGNYNLKTYYCTGTCSSKSIDSQSLQFTGSATVQIISYAFNDTIIIPGQSYTLSIALKNYGTGDAQDVILNMTNYISDDNPFIFVDKPSNFYIGTINLSETKTINFTVKVNEDISRGVYSMPVKSTYDSASYNLGSIDFNVGSSSNISIIKIETDPLQIKKNEEFSVIITVENTGKGKAESVTAYLTGDYTGEKISYIGGLDSNEDDLAILNVLKTKGTEYGIKISYRDDLGYHEITGEYNLEVAPLELNINWTLLLTLAIAGIGIFYLYKKKRKSKK